MAVVYAVMLETGFNKTEFGKGILASCFVTDLGTVIALGLLFAPFTYKTLVFIVGSVVALAALPSITAWLTRHYAHRTAAIRTKWVMLTLFGLGALALWSGSEAVLPAYLAGMVLAGSAARDAHWIRRVRTLTVGCSRSVDLPRVAHGQGGVKDFCPYRCRFFPVQRVALHTWNADSGDRCPRPACGRAHSATSSQEVPDLDAEDISARLRFASSRLKHRILAV